MLTVAVWVKHDLNERYANLVVIPAGLLWVTVTCGLIWYTFVILPGFFTGAPDMKKLITGVVVGAITLIMLYLNFVTVAQFFKRYGKKELREVKAS
jgi:carbon starvation protein